MDQRLDSNDWYMENFGMTVSFSLFGDLMGISKWAKEEEAQSHGNEEEEKMKEIKTGKKSESFDGPSNEPKNNK